jgi:sulfoxide reductase heme-binding subunit YedZ
LASRDCGTFLNPLRVAVRWLYFLHEQARFLARRLHRTVVGRGRADRDSDLVTGIDWYAARAAGVVAYALLTSSVLVGVLLGGKARLRRWPAFALTDLHRFLSVLAGVFIGVHVAALLVDTYAHVSVVTLVVPGASSYRPFWLALGTVAFELLVAVSISNVFRKRLGHARWRRIHYLTFGVWIAATAHGIGAGTDAGVGWLRVLYLVSIGSVISAIAWRVARPAPTPARAPARRGRD